MAVATSTIVALGLAAAAAGANYYNTQKTAERQDEAAGMAIRNQSKKQAQADAEVSKLVDQVGQSNPQDALTAQTDQYLSQLQRNAGDTGLNKGPGGFSDEYRKDTAEASQGLGDFGNKMAGLLARIDAPKYQRQNEGVLFNDAISALGGVKRDAAGQAFLDNLKMKSIRRDPYLDAFSSFAGGASKSAAGGWGGGTGDAGSVADLYADDSFAYF